MTLDSLTAAMLRNPFRENGKALRKKFSGLNNWFRFDPLRQQRTDDHAIDLLRILFPIVADLLGLTAGDDIEFQIDELHSVLQCLQRNDILVFIQPLVGCLDFRLFLDGQLVRLDISVDGLLHPDRQKVGEEADSVSPLGGDTPQRVRLAFDDYQIGVFDFQ